MAPHPAATPLTPEALARRMAARVIVFLILVEAAGLYLLPVMGHAVHGPDYADALIETAAVSAFLYYWLVREGRKRREAEENLRRGYQVQLILNEILEHSLRDAPLEELLEFSADRLLSVPWMRLVPKVGVFLTSEDGRSLRLVVHRGLESVLATCSRVEFGKCLCGRAAERGELLFKQHLDEGHETRYAGIADHGHYCVPIRSEGRTLGLIVLYAAAGHEARREETVFLESLGSTLAGIIERKRARAAAGESERRFGALIANALDLITVLDDKGVATFVSPSIRAILGYSPEEYVGRDAFSFVHEEDRPAAQEAFGRALAQPGSKQSAEFRYRRKDGSWVYLQSFGSALQLPEGRRVIVNSRDLTERRRVEQELTRLATAIEQTGESVVITDAEGRIEYVNPAFLRASGYSREEALGRNPRFLKSGKHDDAFYRGLWETVSAGKVWRGRITNRRKDGALYEDDTVISPVRDAEGRLTHFVAVRRDVSESVRLEEQLRQSQKMESLGLLAGGVAHDFNNMLTLIMGYNEYIADALGPEHALLPFARSVRKAADGAAAMTRQLLAFSRRRVLAPRVFDLNAAVAETGRMLRRLVGESIDFRIDLHSELCPVKADPGQLDQIVLNLVVNARDAMPGGGRLEVETAGVVLPDDDSRAGSSLPPGRYVRLSVRDTGTGMDPAVRERIFEPFYTTKAPGKGTGLGLSTVYGIVRQSSGHIDVESVLGKGTTFRVYLPRAEEPIETLPARPGGDGRSGGETILLVEDDGDLRELVEKTLRRYGYRVFAAGDGPAALDAARRHPGEIHLLLADVLLPGMSGIELSRRFPAVSPATKVLFVSGFANTGVWELLPRGARLLDKPFTGDKLVESVRRALDS
jgi:PAS domain S-box-containing protein